MEARNMLLQLQRRPLPYLTLFTEIISTYDFQFNLAKICDVHCYFIPTLKLALVNME